MILKGHEDLRIVKTIRAVKASFEELISEKEYEKITVKELCERACINKKTFYNYYSSLDHLLAEMKIELSGVLLERNRTCRFPEDLGTVNQRFFLFSEEQGPAYEKIMCSGTYRPEQNGLLQKMAEEAWKNSEFYQKLDHFRRVLLINFVNDAVLQVYRLWIEGGKAKPMEEVIGIANRLVYCGIESFGQE